MKSELSICLTKLCLWRRCDLGESRTAQSAVHNDSSERGDERGRLVSTRYVEGAVAASPLDRFRIR